MVRANNDDVGLDGELRLRRGKLGTEIRRERNAAGPTQEQVADVLGCKQGKIHKIEKGTCGVKPDELRRMLEFLEVGQGRIARIEELARECRLYAERRPLRARAESPEGFREFRDLEQVATDILSWQQGRFPGLLQSEPYMLRLFDVGEQVKDINDAVLERMNRKAVFGKPSLASYRAVIGEEALVRMPGGPNLMIALEQVQYMLKLIRDYPQVSIQVLRFDAKLACPPPGFTIMQLPGEPGPRAFVEHPAGISRFHRPKDLKRFTEDGHRLIRAALSCRETREFLQCRVEELRRDATT